MLGFVLGTTLGVPILVLNGAFVNLWVGPDAYAGPFVNLLIFLIFFQRVFIRIDLTVLDALEEVRPRVLATLPFTVLLIVLCTYFLREYGLQGAGIGTVLVQTGLVFGYTIMLHRKLAASCWTYVSYIARPAFVSLLCLAGAVWAADHARSIDTWPLLFLHAAWIAPSTCVIYLAAGLSGDARRSLFARFLPYWRKQRGVQ